MSGAALAAGIRNVLIARPIRSPHPGVGSPTPPFPLTKHRAGLAQADPSMPIK
jgi:hypothetical protein